MYSQNISIFIFDFARFAFENCYKFAHLRVEKRRKSWTPPRLRRRTLSQSWVQRGRAAQGAGQDRGRGRRQPWARRPGRVNLVNLLILANIIFRVILTTITIMAILTIMTQSFIPTMTNSHYGGNLSRLMIVGIYQWQIPPLMMIIKINNLTQIKALSSILYYKKF